MSFVGNRPVMSNTISTRRDLNELGYGEYSRRFTREPDPLSSFRREYQRANRSWVVRLLSAMWRKVAY